MINHQGIRTTKQVVEMALSKNRDISIEHTVWCSVCSNWDQLPGTLKVCIADWIKSGWRKRNERWICPDCLKKQEKEAISNFTKILKNKKYGTSK